MQETTTVVDPLRYKALQHPRKPAFIFLQDGEITAHSLTYQALKPEARSIATKLQIFVTKGDSAPLLYPLSLGFISAFFGYLFTQVVAVPAYPPRRNQNLERLQAFVADTQATVVLTTKFFPVT